MNLMKKIASFTVNHDKLEKGMYISRKDRNIITYDIRMKKPNCNDFLTTGAMHTFEHLFATYVRNTELKDDVIYVGPMGCRTGFYFVVREHMTDSKALEIIKETFNFIKDFEGKIPGSERTECGNYLDHDLNGAKAVAADMLNVLKDWNTEKMNYEYHF